MVWHFTQRWKLKSKSSRAFTTRGNTHQAVVSAKVESSKADVAVMDRRYGTPQDLVHEVERRGPGHFGETPLGTLGITSVTSSSVCSSTSNIGFKTMSLAPAFATAARPATHASGGPNTATRSASSALP
jgi:hypothetical protein